MKGLYLEWRVYRVQQQSKMHNTSDVTEVYEKCVEKAWDGLASATQRLDVACRRSVRVRQNPPGLCLEV